VKTNFEQNIDPKMKTKTKLLAGWAVLASLLNGFSQPATNATFTRITTGSIVTDAAHSFGCSWGDYDDDGYLDMIVGNGIGDANALYRNNGDGTFTRITTNLIATTIGDTDGVVWGDYDNDGHLDLFAANWQIPSFLFRNDGHGNFTRVSAAEIALAAADSNGCGWGDYDNDGFLDLVIANGSVQNAQQNEHLYRNNGDGGFTRILTGPVPNSGAINGVPAWGDYDNDGKLDLAMSAGGPGATSVMFLFHNEGGGNFSTVTKFPTLGPGEGGVEWGDYDNDGDLDLLGGRWDPPAVIVYRNDGGGVFTRLLVASFNARPQGASWGDYDNDGWLDFFIYTGFVPGQTVAGSDLLFHNNGDGTFTRITEGEIVNTVGLASGAAWGDYDNDGFLDLYVANGNDPAQEPNFLYHNDGNSNRWLTVKCIGTASNRSGIGAKVRVRANIGGQALWQLREVTSGNGFNGGGLRAYFGLGDATNVDLIRIEWPSGTVQELQNVAVNQLLTVREPPRLRAIGGQPDGSFQFEVIGAAGFSYGVLTSSNLSSWMEWKTVGMTNRTTLVTDPSATNAPIRFYRLSTPWRVGFDAAGGGN
jgi:hypothetical protein